MVAVSVLAGLPAAVVGLVEKYQFAVQTRGRVAAKGNSFPENLFIILCILDYQ